MALSLKLFGTTPLLVALLVLTQARADSHEDDPSGQNSSSPDLPHQTSLPTSLSDKTDAFLRVFVAQLLDAMREERGQAVETAVHPLHSTQARLEHRMDGVTEELSDQQVQLADMARSAATLEDGLDAVRQEVDGMNSSFARRMEEFGEPLSHALSAMEERLQSLESRLNATESQLNSESHPLRQKGSGEKFPRDCSDLPAGSPSDIYLLHLDQSQPPVSAFCDMDTDGGRWTVFQRRDEAYPQRDFFLDWAAYREGFGEPGGEFWWGLKHLWRLTAAPDRRYQLRVDLWDFDGDHLHASYGQFGVSNEEDGYRLLGGHFTGGGAGDSLSKHFGQRFSTKDRDQDTGTSHCARKRKGGWWYHACHDANLNGPYLAGRTPKDVYGVNWPTWRGWRYSLKRVEMKIRPRSEH